MITVSDIIRSQLQKYDIVESGSQKYIIRNLEDTYASLCSFEGGWFSRLYYKIKPTGEKYDMEGIIASFRLAASQVFKDSEVEVFGNEVELIAYIGDVTISDGTIEHTVRDLYCKMRFSLPLFNYCDESFQLTSMTRSIKDHLNGFIHSHACSYLGTVNGFAGVCLGNSNLHRLLCHSSVKDYAYFVGLFSGIKNFLKKENKADAYYHIDSLNDIQYDSQHINKFYDEYIKTVDELPVDFILENNRLEILIDERLLYSQLSKITSGIVEEQTFESEIIFKGEYLTYKILAYEDSPAFYFKQIRNFLITKINDKISETTTYLVEGEVQ